MNYHLNLYHFQETACSYESRIYYIHFLRIGWEWNIGSHTKVTLFFVFWCDLQLVFLNLKFFNSLWRKNSAFSVLSKYFRVLSDIGLTEFQILSDLTKFCRTKLFKKPIVKHVRYYFQSLKGKKYSIYIKVLRVPTKQRDDIKSNCCHI